MFNDETFEGNGRSCGTCHRPDVNYNIFPDTIRKLNRKEKRLVFVPHVPGLENKTLVREFALFNIAGGPHSDASDIFDFNSDFCKEHPHDCPIFRSSMTVQALDATTFIGAGGFDGTPLLPAECSEGDILDANGVAVPVVDPDGNPVVGMGMGMGGGAVNVTVRSQLAQLGWAGDGSPGTAQGRSGAIPLVWRGDNSPGAATGQGGDMLECRTHHGNEDINADGTIRGFANGAIAQHNPKTLARIAKTTACPHLSVDEPHAYCDQHYDFRFASNAELDAMALFQRWLGRLFLTEDERARMEDPAGRNGSPESGEFDVSLMGFTDPRIVRGREHFLVGGEFNAAGNRQDDFGTGCDVCHVNGGGRAAPFGGGNQSFVTNVDLARTSMGEDAFGPVGVSLPHDEGALTVPGGHDTRGEDAFNNQSIIEAPQKRAFFHNHRVEGDIEDAIREFYASEDFATRNGAFSTLEGLAFGDPEDNDPTDNDFPQHFPDGDGIEHLGAFLRTLSAYYKLRDCERLIDEAIARINVHVSPHLALQHCGFNLEDARTALRGSHLRPRPHRDVMIRAHWIKRALNRAGRHHSTHRLENIKAGITAMKESIATLPPLPTP